MDYVTITHEATSVLTVSGEKKTLSAVIIPTHGHVHLVRRIWKLTEDGGPCLLHMLLKVLDTVEFVATPSHLLSGEKGETRPIWFCLFPLFTILHGTHLSVYNESERHHLHALFVPCLKRSMTTSGHIWAKGSVCLFVSRRKQFVRRWLWNSLNFQSRICNEQQEGH